MAGWLVCMHCIEIQTSFCRARVKLSTVGHLCRMTSPKGSSRQHSEVPTKRANVGRLAQRSLEGHERDGQTMRAQTIADISMLLFMISFRNSSWRDSGKKFTTNCGTQDDRSTLSRSRWPGDRKEMFARCRMQRFKGLPAPSTPLRYERPGSSPTCWQREESKSMGSVPAAATDNSLVGSPEVKKSILFLSL